MAVFNHGTGTGHRIEVGGEFGHKTVWVIAKVGKNVTEFEIGQRVYPYPRYAKGDTRKAGIIGGFSEYILVPNAKLNHSLYFVPEKITDKTASLIEPYTVGCRAARRARPQNGESAVVFGCGTIGLAAAISFKWFSCRNVMICDLSDYRLNIAKNLGFEVCNISTGNFFNKSVSFFGEAQGLGGIAPNADIFIDAAGHESVLDLYMKHGKIESLFYRQYYRPDSDKIIAVSCVRQRNFYRSCNEREVYERETGIPAAYVNGASYDDFHAGQFSLQYRGQFFRGKNR